MTKNRTKLEAKIIRREDPDGGASAPAENAKKETREARLAAALRENLRRRKAGQTKAKR